MNCSEGLASCGTDGTLKQHGLEDFTAGAAAEVCKGWRARVLTDYELPLVLGPSVSCLPAFSRVHTIALFDVAYMDETL